MNGEGGLAELWEYACAMDRLAAERPLRDVTFGGKWVVVGYGMFMPELRACGAEVDVVDLRPRCDLCTVQVGPSGVHRGPQGVAFHGPEATAGLFSEADVLFITGCTLVNRTFFDLMALPRRAREVVLFGPSGCAPFEALARSGVTCVAGTVVLDGGALVCSVLGEDVEPTVLRAAVQGYVAHLPPCRGACADRA